MNSILSDNVLTYFKNFQDPTSQLYKNAFLPQFPTDFLTDAATGNLPQVSWVIASLVDSDHPPAPSLFGEITLSAMLAALTVNSAQWAKTALFLTFDENGGFFDHVPPITAPPGTSGEYLTVPLPCPTPTVGGRFQPFTRKCSCKLFPICARLLPTEGRLGVQASRMLIALTKPVHPRRFSGDAKSRAYRATRVDDHFDPARGQE